MQENSRKLANVVLLEGCPDLRTAQYFTSEKGMGLRATLAVPRNLSEDEAREFVTAALLKATSVVPELSFCVVVGVPDL